MSEPYKLAVNKLDLPSVGKVSLHSRGFHKSRVIKVAKPPDPRAIYHGIYHLTIGIHRTAHHKPSTMPSTMPPIMWAIYLVNIHATYHAIYLVNIIGEGLRAWECTTLELPLGLPAVISGYKVDVLHIAKKLFQQEILDQIFDATGTRGLHIEAPRKGKKADWIMGRMIWV
ncbi:hypothetical protein B0H14DRAFT_2648793 [Mycena olivaceomarginata]|nr:hypothetical protein B0H14DRAFT_2648793 [Mycena olivaceomarginata]